jgi:hypothetical protein
MGCFVNPPQTWPGEWRGEEHYLMPVSTPVSNNGLTYEEKECLRHLADAWAIFSKLEEKHAQDNSEFVTAIHDAQKMIALRVARRVDKEIWSQPSRPLMEPI